jgi:hypothetical protein
MSQQYPGDERNGIGPPPPPPPAWYPPGQPYGQVPPQPYGQVPPQPGYYYGPPVRQATNGLAIASMVLGIIWLYWLGSILALIFGFIAKKQIDESRGMQRGRGMAIAGIVLGWVGVGTLTLAILFSVLVRINNG